MPPATSRPERGAGRLVLLLGATAVGGAGTMTVELAAVRLLSPWFGSSTVVWTNVIAVVLLALSAGYLLGARLSAAREPVRWLGRGLVAAGACAALLPVASAPVAGWFLPDQLALHEAAGVVLWGSLASSLLLFLPPALLLGTVSPLAVQAIGEAAEARAGAAGGLVLATSTVGSLVGVFGTSHVFVPVLGLRGTFLLAAALLLGAGAVVLLAARAERRLLLGALVLFAAGALLPADTTPARPGERELARVESPYQRVRVVEVEGREPVRRLLQVNEGFDSFQSVWQPAEGPLPEGYYYNGFALPLHWLAPRAEARVLVLGLGAGTAFRVLSGAAPEGLSLVLAGVELDPEVVALAREHLGLVAPAAKLGASAAGDLVGVAAGLDARVALRCVRDASIDLVVLDCYANQVEIPPHLATREFFAELLARLRPGGFLAANLGGFGFDDPLVAAVAATCRAAWSGDVALVRVPLSRNYLLLARRDAELPIDAQGRVLEVPGVLRPALGALELAGMARRPAPGEGEVLTDDRAPLEELQSRSLAEARRRREALAP